MPCGLVAVVSSSDLGTPLKRRTRQGAGAVCGDEVQGGPSTLVGAVDVGTVGE